MKAIDRPFTKIVNGTSQFVIPVFQRDYTWQTEPQCSQLWRDVLRAAASKAEHGHFLGSVVYIATGDSLAGFTRWLLIDGQQRLTTLTLLLTALRDHIHDTSWQGGEDAPTPKRIDAYFLKNVEEEGDRSQKLVLRRHDQDTLWALLYKQPLPLEPSERIRDNYKFFREQLENANPAEVYKGIGRLVVVDVALDRQSDDPQLIFESLNSTGVDLSQSDLIRNFILMRLPEADQTNLYKTYWSKIEKLFRGSEVTFDLFARDYVALKTQANKQGRSSDIYYSFREFFPSLVEKSGGVEGALNDMLRFAGYYAAFSLGREMNSRRDALAKVRHLVDVPAMLVMRLFEYRDHLKTLSESEFMEALSLIESYVMRRAICGYQTRGYWQVFASLAYKLGDVAPLTDLKVALATQRENNRFPSDEEFERSLKEKDVYGLRVCRQFLESLENHGTRERTDTSNYSIEHIMPQNERLGLKWRAMLGENWKAVQKTWIHRLGNLTLTGYNSKYSDRPFEEKKNIKGGFNDSSVRLNKFIREQGVWAEREMESRTSELAKLATSVWPPLSVPQNLIDAAKNAEKRLLASSRRIEDVRMSVEAKALFDILHAKALELDANVFELADTSSISYHGPEFFMELIPRRYSLTVLLPLNFNEIDDSSGLAQDTTQWRFIANAQYEGGVSMSISTPKDILAAMPLIHLAYATSLA